jgi:hypothetical protein
VTVWHGGNAAGEIIAAGDKRVHEQALQLLAWDSDNS